MRNRALDTLPNQSKYKTFKYSNRAIAYINKAVCTLTLNIKCKASKRIKAEPIVEL